MYRIAIALSALAVAACSPPDVTDTKSRTTVPGTDTPAPFAAQTWVRDNFAKDGPVTFREGRADLDGDGSDELLIYTGGAMVCGSGGCPLSVLRLTADGPEVLAQTTVTQLPVGVLDTSTNGMRDIWVTTVGGGAPEQTRKLSFDGKSYPKNPTMTPAETIEAPGTVVIALGEMTPVPQATPAAQP